MTLGVVSPREFSISTWRCSLFLRRVQSNFVNSWSWWLCASLLNLALFGDEWNFFSTSTQDITEPKQLLVFLICLAAELMFWVDWFVWRGPFHSKWHLNRLSWVGIPSVGQLGNICWPYNVSKSDSNSTGEFLAPEQRSVVWVDNDDLVLGSLVYRLWNSTLTFAFRERLIFNSKLKFRWGPWNKLQRYEGFVPEGFFQSLIVDYRFTQLCAF